MAIGVFDSGVGGLSVLRQCRKYFPKDTFLYLGDTKHMPYGKKTRDEVVNYTKKAFSFFEKEGVKAGIIACNTATAAALDEVQKNFSFPIFGVIKPACQEVVKRTINNKVLLIATEGTVKSNVYENTIKEYNRNIFLESIGCPHLVIAVEDGYGDHYIGGKIAIDYISRAKEKDFDTLILGCTHFPVVQRNLEDYFKGKRRKIEIIDPAYPTVKDLLKNIPPETKRKGKVKYYVTGDVKKFEKVAKKITGEKISACFLELEKNS
ncbi:MAG: glutamate racemase [Tissierellia bacterium]|nr:glutamate racemase [Tissierellia bacterium]